MGTILHGALETSQSRGVSRSRITDLTERDRDYLALATLEYLRSRRHTPSPHPGWQQVRGFDAGVLRWWNDHLGGPFPSPTTQRLQTLRGDIYDFLEDEVGLIVKEPGQNSPVHLAPPDRRSNPTVDEFSERTIHVTDGGAGFGDAETNRLVEAAAMRLAVESYAGWEAQDVSRDKCGWDLTFSREDEVHHVEVKGVAGQKPRILLTRNEVAVAREDPNWRLLVVTRALVDPKVHVFNREAMLASVDAYMYVADLS